MPARTPKTKISRVRADMQNLAADTLVVSDPQAVSWLFNIRGSDVPHTPVVLAFALLPKEGRPALYVDLRKLGNEMRASLEDIAEVRPNAAFERDLAELGKERRALRLDPSACAEAIARLVVENGGTIVRGSDPVAPLKAIKNATEIAGARAAQQRDGVGGDAIPRLVRSRSAARHPDRDRRGRGVGELSPRHRAPEGRVVPDHLRRRPERRHRALPRHPPRATAASRRATCS